MSHTKKHLLETFSNDYLNAWMYSSGGVRHSIRIRWADGKEEWHSFNDHKKARTYVEELMEAEEAKHSETTDTA